VCKGRQFARLLLLLPARQVIHLNLLAAEAFSGSFYYQIISMKVPEQWARWQRDSIEIKAADLWVRL